MHQVSESPVETARHFYDCGARYIHMVDLDGARDGLRKNTQIVREVVDSVSARIELGGGIRSMEMVDTYISRGISRVILGSAALRDREFLKRAVDKYKEKIAVGIDAKNGKVSVAGWLDDSDVDYIQFAKEMEKEGVKNIIFTDISKDGTLAGPNLEQLSALSKAVSCDITASGGIHNLEDIKNLKEMNLYGAIAGRSLYDGTLDLKEAINITFSLTEKRK